MLRTKEWLAAQYERQRTFYGQRNRNISSWLQLWALSEQYYFRNAEGEFIPAEDDEERVIPSTAFNIVQGMQQLLLTRPPTISVPPSGLKKVGRDQAQNIQNMLYAIWYDAHVHKCLCDAAWWALVSGWMVLHPFFDVNAPEDECPIRVEIVDPATVFPMPGPGLFNWLWVIRAYKDTLASAEERFFPGLDKRRAGVQQLLQLKEYYEGDEVHIIEYWDKTHYGVLMLPDPAQFKEDLPFPDLTQGIWAVSMTEHNYGCLPWIIRFGLDVPLKQKGEQFGISVLYPVEALILYWARLLSQKGSIIRRFADPKLVTVAEGGREVDTEGTEIRLAAGEQAYYLGYAGTTPNVDIQMEEVSGQIQQATVPEAFFGSYIGRMSGIALDILRQPTLMKIAFLQTALEDAAEKLNEALLRLVEQFVGTKRYLRGRMPDGEAIEVFLDPETINGYRFNIVRLSASVPSEAPAILTMLLAAQGQKIVSKRAVREVLSILLRDIAPQQLDEEEEQVIMEQVLDNPMLLAMLAQALAKKYGYYLPLLPEQEQAATQPEGQAVMGLPGGQGRTPFSMMNTEPSLIQGLRRITQTMPGGVRQRGGRPAGGALTPPEG